MSFLVAACIHDSVTPPPGYEDKVAELDAQGLLRERQRLVEEITFLEERIGELRAVQMAQGPDSTGRETRAQRLEGLEQWRDLAARKKAHVDAILASGAFTRHSVRYKVNPEVLRADREPAKAHATAREQWDDLPAVDQATAAINGPAMVHRLSHETDGDTLRVRIEYSGRATARLSQEDEPRAIVVEMTPVAEPDTPQGSVVIGPAQKMLAPAEAAPEATAMRPTAKPKASPAPVIASGPLTVLGVEHRPEGKGFAARIRLNHQAAKYRYFTMDNPPRIVVDVYGARPPSRTHRIIPVGEAQTLRIRTGWHQGQGQGQGKFRMVLDTSPSYLSSFKVVSDPSGVAVLLP